MVFVSLPYMAIFLLNFWLYHALTNPEYIVCTAESLPEKYLARAGRPCASSHGFLALSKLREIHFIDDEERLLMEIRYEKRSPTFQILGLRIHLESRSVMQPSCNCGAHEEADTSILVHIRMP
ncbi:hypothetical protein GQR58_029985 [Nymphon striatum]|nr:hypothetical protein GQR58_029985 [Nymphon striatum]